MTNKYTLDKSTDPLEIISENLELKTLMEKVVTNLSVVLNQPKEDVNILELRKSIMGANYSRNMGGKKARFCLGLRVMAKINPYTTMEGLVIATRTVGNIALLGVEFDREIKYGHSLNQRTDGILGREKHYKWFLPGEVNIVT